MRLAFVVSSVLLAVACVLTFVAVQDVAYFARGHESVLGGLVYRWRTRRLRKRAIRIPCTRVDVIEGGQKR